MIKLNNQIILTKADILKGKIQKMDLLEECANMLKKVKTRAEREILEPYHYQTINEHSRNQHKNLNCRAYALTISQNSGAEHMLKVSMLHPTMMIEDTRLLASGNRNEILKYLANEKAAPELRQNLIEMSEKLSKC